MPFHQYACLTDALSPTVNPKKAKANLTILQGSQRGAVHRFENLLTENTAQEAALLHMLLRAPKEKVPPSHTYFLRSPSPSSPVQA